MENGVMMQFFEWDLPNTGQLWAELKEEAARLAAAGITAVWIPPAYKAISQQDVGYATYDLYDFGEFNQKGTVRTKYGTRQQLQETIRELHRCGIAVYLDAVMNHKAGADFKEKFRVKEVDADDRGQETTDAYEIEAWTGFDFPGRKGKYSGFVWHWYHFTGTDYDARHDRSAIFKIQGKEWAQEVDGENGNYDYLMFANIDYNRPEVVEEMKRWGAWAAREFGFDGFRLDAVKHINRTFMENFLRHVRQQQGEAFYAVGEYWKEEEDDMAAYLAAGDYKVDLFDVPLHFNFAEAARGGREADLRTLLDGSLVQQHPALSVTFVDNHDTQPGQSLESFVDDWFKPMAYALILLMQEGYPCLFYGDYYGIGGQPAPHRDILDRLLECRRTAAYGEQKLYFDHPNTIGLVRQGDEAHPGSGLALLLSNGDDGDKMMEVGAHHAGERWREVTGSRTEEIVIDEAGYGRFSVGGGKCAVWRPCP